MGTNQPTIGDPAKVLEVTLGCRPDQIAEQVIVTPFVPLKAFRRHAEENSVFELAPPFFFKGFTARFGGKPVSVILTGVGPSRIGDVVSILSLTPARRVIFAGAVGSLHPDWELGEWFIPLEAADGEGYTRYLLNDFDRVVDEAARVGCSGGLEAKLEEVLARRDLTVRKGSVFTIGSIASESDGNLQLLADRGFDALEMELSAFYAAARHHGLEAAALTFISDLPLSRSLWQEKTGEENKILNKAWRLLPLLCMELAAHVA